jgi:hypothetical protein|tara:strand:- start:546 stop:884 length:339 start_codon:yes stop_codon:yes gene_type:complete
VINKEVMITICILFFTQIIIWYQLNGQLIWKWAKDNPFLLACLGLPISYMLILSTKYGYIGFGQLWPIRLLGFATGMISFPIITWMMLGEGVSIKTGISMFLGLLIMLLQLI